MSTELSVLNDLNLLPSTQLGNDDQFDDLAKGAEFLPRMQLYTKGKAIDTGKIKPGNYGIPDGDEIIDLGNSIDLLVLARRPKAIDMSDSDAIIVNYDPESAEFKRIAATSLEKESSCMYGPSFLVIERKSARFLEFFCGGKSTRSEAKKIYPFMPLTEGDIKARQLTDQEPHGPVPMTLKSKHVEKGKWSWHVPVVTKCSLPFDKVPANARIIAEITKFVNPKADETEKVQEPKDEEKGGKKKRAR